MKGLHLEFEGSIGSKRILSTAKHRLQRDISPVARMKAFWIVLAITAQLKLKVFQLDVKSTFLNGELEEEVYME